MGKLDYFLYKFGPASQCKGLDRQSNKALTKLPPELVDIWKNDGLCTYADGLIFMNDPDTLHNIAAKWVNTDFKEPLVFARTAFGDLFVLDEEEVHIIFVHSNKVFPTRKRVLDFLDTWLPIPGNLKNLFLQDLYKKARKKLGPLSHDECYGFFPALALGGQPTLKYVKKVGLAEHLLFLSQVYQ